MQDRIENFFEVGSNFTDDGSFGYFYLRFHRNACENDFSLMGSSEHGGWRELHELSLEPRKECHTKILPRSEKKELSATAKQRYCLGLSKQNYCQ